MVFYLSINFPLLNQNKKEKKRINRFRFLVCIILVDRGEHISTFMHNYKKSKNDIKMKLKIYSRKRQTMW